jgi:hypothetical protein
MAGPRAKRDEEVERSRKDENDEDRKSEETK